MRRVLILQVFHEGAFAGFVGSADFMEKIVVKSDCGLLSFSGNESAFFGIEMGV